MPKISLDTVDFLPLFNACVNGGVFLILISALVAIKKGKRQLHMKLMYSALILSVIFLISYVFIMQHMIQFHMEVRDYLGIFIILF